MSVKQAVVYNCVSSILCFIGMLVGVAIGNIHNASLWVFAGVGGMFLYISMVDMVSHVPLRPCGRYGESCSCTSLWLIRWACSCTSLWSVWWVIPVHLYGRYGESCSFTSLWSIWWVMFLYISVVDMVSHVPVHLYGWYGESCSCTPLWSVWGVMFLYISGQYNKSCSCTSVWLVWWVMFLYISVVNLVSHVNVRLYGGFGESCYCTSLW